jgi:hypothetical protein
MSTFKSIAMSAAVILSIGLFGSANAGIIVGGTSILTNPADVAQLETWLGEGPLTLTNIYTKGDGDTSLDWHNAVDYKGRTFSVLVATVHDPNANNGNGAYVDQILGGYNPVSWESNNINLDWRVTTPDSERNAFIFNLSTGLLQTQCKSTDDPKCGSDGDTNNDFGAYQTRNNVSFGPSFGGGYDLGVNQLLDRVTLYNFSYGAFPFYTGSVNENALDPDDSYFVGTGGGIFFSMSALETFAIEPMGSGSVPEPATIALFAPGLLGIGFAYRNRKRRAV